MLQKIREDGLVATFGCDDNAGPHPGLLALGGSDGGTPEYFLNLFVPEGFAVLALTYWGTPDTQMTLAEIPLERVELALRWLRDRPDVAAVDGRVGVVGASRGAELALLAAATFPGMVGPVVAYTPSSVAWMGLDFSTPGRLCSTWTYQGSQVPFAPFPSDVAPIHGPRGLSMRPVVERGLEDADAIERAAIAIEKAAGPLLVLSGGDDRVWPTERMCEMLVARMAAHHRQGDITHLHYPVAGHMLFPYTRPSDVSFPAFPFDPGGTAESDAHAHASAWPTVVAHLRR